MEWKYNFTLPATHVPHGQPELINKKQTCQLPSKTPLFDLIAITYIILVAHKTAGNTSCNQKIIVILNFFQKLFIYLTTTILSSR